MISEKINFMNELIDVVHQTAESGHIMVFSK